MKTFPRPDREVILKLHFIIQGHGGNYVLGSQAYYVATQTYLVTMLLTIYQS